MITFAVDWVQVLGLVLGVVLPLLVAIVTRETTSPGVRAILLAALSLITNLLTGIESALIAHTAFDLSNAMLLSLGTFIVAVASHFGFWQPTRVSGWLLARVGLQVIPKKDKPELPAHEGRHSA